MTDTVRRHATGHARAFEVRRLHERRAIDALLSDDRAYAAYALAYLEPGLFEEAQFWTAEGPGGTGVVLLADSLGASVITAGDPAAVDAILSLHPGRRRSYLATAAPAHMAAVERWHHVEEPLAMQRMSVTQAAFEPEHGAVRRLRGFDARAINGLYALDDRPSHYSAAQIERSVYFGAYDGRRLVAIAGTHVVSPAASLGMVGNVLTHPAYRGQGLAKRVTAAVTEELFAVGCSLVVLTAASDNVPAVQAYGRLGYQPGAQIVEAHLRRRDPLAIGAWLRRRRLPQSA